MKNEYDITKATGFNPGLEAKRFELMRPVKVKTIGNLSYSDVEKIMWENTANGWQPAWEEIIEEDTPELDTVTVQNVVSAENQHLTVHQTTIPIPLDLFPVCTGMSLSQIMNYTESICEREHWQPTYRNRMIALDHLNMG
ncbi:hypothetical protein [Treponema sp.]|uniref:hypothetical protein n=1 Tax=Treponema sp. TaxID=166 RepID=UPI00298D7364|nr:hypothetical protein [Treponema sp.]